MKNNIKDLRVKHSLTQDELAEQLDVSRLSLEKERYSPSITIAFKLARIFNGQIEVIFIDEKDKSLRNLGKLIKRLKIIYKQKYTATL